MLLTAIVQMESEFGILLKQLPQIDIVVDSDIRTHIFLTVPKRTPNRKSQMS